MWTGDTILGTPSGKVIARLLLQHREQFGRKVVESAVFLRLRDVVKDPALLLKLEDVNEAESEAPVRRVRGTTSISWV